MIRVAFILFVIRPFGVARTWLSGRSEKSILINTIIFYMIMYRRRVIDIWSSFHLNNHWVIEITFFNRFIERLSDIYLRLWWIEMSLLSNLNLLNLILRTTLVGVSSGIKGIDEWAAIDMVKVHFSKYDYRIKSNFFIKFQRNRKYIRNHSLNQFYMFLNYSYLLLPISMSLWKLTRDQYLLYEFYQRQFAFKIHSLVTHDKPYKIPRRVYFLHVWFNFLMKNQIFTIGIDTK